VTELVLYVHLSFLLFPCLLLWVQLNPGKSLLMAGMGDLNGLQAMAKFNPRALAEVDKLGWTAFHEGTRSGNLEVVKFLLDNGADMNVLTDAGLSPLWIARHFLGENHEVSKYLEELGAILTPQEEDEEEERDDL
jgi:ankyrin repeat protein